MRQTGPDAAANEDGRAGYVEWYETFPIGRSRSTTTSSDEQHADQGYSADDERRARETVHNSPRVSY